MNVALILARGGSKSIPLKNIKTIAGHPLLYYTIKAAQYCNDIDEIYVSTDSKKIKEVVNRLNFAKVKVISRGEETATDTASSEVAMVEFAKNHFFDNIIMIQATSPLLTSNDIHNGFSIYNKKNTDSVLSVVRQKRFNWKVDKYGYAKALNYDIYNRPRRQEFRGYYVENGAFYITSRELLLKTECRISGRIRICEMNSRSYNEIDEIDDWNIIEQLLINRVKEENKKLISGIRVFLTDCDGVLTDGGMYYSEFGDELKKFNAKDGMGFEILKKKGIITGIITKEEKELNRNRAKKLCIDEYKSGVKDKLSAVEEIADKYNLAKKQVMYIGDDINDLEVMKSVGFSCAPNDACTEIRTVSDYVAKKWW